MSTNAPDPLSSPESNLASAQAQITPVTKKGLAIAALILGIIAFLTGLVPVLGIILGAVGVILGIIALVQKQPKGLALTGTILAAVGLICSLVVTIIAGAVTSAVVETINQETSVTVETPDDDDQDFDSDDAGTRENPYPLGTLISSSDWDVTVNSVTLNANDLIAAANQFNTPPADGSQYALANVTVTYKGEGSNYPSFVGIDYVTADGVVVNTWESLVIAPEPTFGATELLTGGTATANMAFEIPVAADGLLRVSPGFFADEVYVSLQ